ncbi:MAG TPA: PAAR domain-containing protein, partial [Luteimonas sp.]|nr:PAAR domain-containing protein [Luteimonas sp.]
MRATDFSTQQVARIAALARRAAEVACSEVNGSHDVQGAHMVRKIIVVGDTTTGGGRVETGTPFTDIDGMPVARLGDRVSCPKHKGVFPIASGDITLVVDGQPVARERDAVACGCTLVSARQSHAFLDDGALAGASKTVLDRPAEAGAAQPSPAGLRPAPFAGPDGAGQQDVPVAVTLRIGVFFDGTNNNVANVALGAQCRASTGDALGQDADDQATIAAHCRPYMQKEGSSYDNGVTNVARLYELYRDSVAQPPAEDASEYALRVYVDGIGTTAGEPDSPLSQGLGSGGSGVVARVEEAFKTLIPAELETFSAQYPDKLVKAVEFDVFGFSRGAAAARHFVHLVNRKGHGRLGQALLNRGVRFAPGFEFVQGVQVGFVGLFDSVAALGSLADGLNVRDQRNGPLQQALPAGCARQVVHLVARDERR